MQTPHFRSSHLDLRDAQCAETKDVLKISYHITSRLGAVGVQKGRSGCLKITISSKVVKKLETKNFKESMIQSLISRRGGGE